MRRVQLRGLLSWALLAAATVSHAGEISFRNDVMAVLSKAGCNLGTCHGNANGKGGFQLSLRGQDPEKDFATLTHDLSARRVNITDPERSLILLKPTMRLAHEGGRRFTVGSPEYVTLRDWIAARTPADDDGMPRLVKLEVTPTERILIDPDSEVPLHVEAKFSDGGTRDVTRIAVYEPVERIVTVSHAGDVRRQDFGEATVLVRYLDQQVPVRLAFVPARPDFVWTGPSPVNLVDDHVFAKLRRLRINPSELCDDTTFLRRAYLDLLGIIPTAEESHAFVNDTHSDKRARLIDELLDRPEFADWWALKWSDLLRNEEKTLDRKGVENFQAWIRQSIAQNKPVDQFVRELVASRGSTYVNPESNYYRAMRDPFMRAESTAQLFLGVRLQCAKCHNHPFDRWTQDDYYSWSNLFARVDYKVLENRRRDRNDSHEFDGEQIVYMKRSGDVDDPRRGQPRPPKFLSPDATALSDDEDRLLALADWLTHPDNEMFVQSQVNRVWYHLFGRGIVEPIDDFRATNPPINPELLDGLAREFVAHQFDLRHLIRTIMNSRTYQLSSVPNETNRGDEANFSHALVRRLSAEQLLDGLSQATDVPLEFAGYPTGLRAGQLPGVQAIRSRDNPPTAADRFLKLFGKPPRLQSCECERTTETTLAQTFQMVSGPFLDQLLTTSGNRLDQLLSAHASNKELLEELYWTTLSRAPSAEELRTTEPYLQSASNLRIALEDVAWSVLNSNEFLLRR